MSTGPLAMPQGWTPEMSDFVRDLFLDGEGLVSVQILFFAEYAEMEGEVSDAWFISLRPAGWS